MAQEEIMRMIPADTLARIKAEDPEPIFKAFVVGHEGEARPHIVGGGSVFVQWIRSAISKLAERLRYGTKLFFNHAETNEHEGRTEIGEVVAKSLRFVGDKLSAVMVGYIYPQFRKQILDVASIEAEVDFSALKEGVISDRDIGDVTGIALGNSASNQPAFPHATLIGEVQAFLDSQFTPSGGKAMTVEELLAEIKAQKFKPSDLFGADALTGDPVFKQEVHRATNSEYATRMRENEKHGEQLSEIKKQLEEKDKELKRLQVDAAKSQLGEMFSKAKTSRALDEAQSAFIEKRIPRFQPSSADSISKEFDQFLDAQVDEFNEFKNLIAPSKDGGGEGKGAGSRAADQRSAQEKILDPNASPLE